MSLSRTKAICHSKELVDTNYIVPQTTAPDTPRLYKLNCGDTFTVSINLFASTSALWNDRHFLIKSIKQMRTKRVFKIFGIKITIPGARQWVIEFVYSDNTTEDKLQTYQSLGGNATIERLRAGYGLKPIQKCTS